VVTTIDLDGMDSTCTRRATGGQPEKSRAIGSAIADEAD